MYLNLLQESTSSSVIHPSNEGLGNVQRRFGKTKFLTFPEVPNLKDEDPL
jgi:hypothetical protein